MAQQVTNPPTLWETWVLSRDWEDSPGEGNRYPLQYSGLENSMDCIVHQVAESWTRLSDFHFHANNKQSKNKVKKKNPFIIAPKSIKYLQTEFCTLKTIKYY